MTWLPYLLALGLGVGLVCVSRRLRTIEDEMRVADIRISNLAATSNHAQRSYELALESIGDVRRKLADHAVDIVNHADEIHSLQTQVDRYVAGDDVKPAPNPWINRGGLN